VDFSEARDLFGIIFQFWGLLCETLDCGLILKKLRGLSAKMPEIRISRNCFSKGNPVDRAGVAGPRFHRGLHGGRWPELVGARPTGRSGPRRLAMSSLPKGESMGTKLVELFANRVVKRRNMIND
jgi:hypothetical protein